MRRHWESWEVSLAAGRRGRCPKEQMALIKRQQAQTAKTIMEKSLDQFGLPGFLLRDLVPRSTAGAPSMARDNRNSSGQPRSRRSRVRAHQVAECVVLLRSARSFSAKTVY